MLIDGFDSGTLGSHAALLYGLAEDVRAVAERLDRGADVEGFAGPAAERFGDAMNERAMRLRNVAAEFDDLSVVVLQDIPGRTG